MKLAECFLRTNPIAYLKVKFKHGVIEIENDILGVEYL